MNTVDAVLLVCAVTLATAVGARHLRTPLPVVLAGAGLALGLGWHVLPGRPRVDVSGDVVLLVFLPPLLARAAHDLPLAAFRRNLRAISMLAVGLVLATMAGAAAVAHAADPTLPWAAAFVLGAIVAPPDPVAATAVAGRTGLANRLVTILEGEGLVNDAVAIVAYRLAVDAATTGRFTWAHALATLAVEAPVGVAVGLAVGWGTVQLRRRLDDVTLEAGISFLVPYLTYELADRLHGSAVLAVVTLGFMLRRRATEIATPAARLGTRTVWSAVDFVTTALVFLLVGLGAGGLATALTPRLLATGAAVAAAVVAIRFAWMYAVPPLVSLARRPAGAGAHAPIATRAERAVLAWAGMRGVVSLALALALPPLRGRVAGTDPRETVVLVSVVVILATLVAQGVTLLPLVERLGVGDPERGRRDERLARRRARRAGMAALARLARRGELAPDACRELAGRLESGDVGIANAGATRPVCEALGHALRAQDGVVARLRARGRISDVLATRLETELDLDAVRIRGDASRLSGTEEP